MKKIIFTFFLFTSFDAYALPDCPDDVSTIWNNCFGFSTMGYDGDTYEGEWRNDMPNGQGTYIFANGDKYVGNFKDDKYNGQGTYTHANGDKYVGNYKDDQYHGLGTYTFADGYEETGFYMNGKYIPEICEDMGLSVNSSGYENCINRLIEAVLD